MEVPRQGIELELQLPTYTTATATWDLSQICDLHHSSWQCRILNSLSEARDGPFTLINTSQMCFCCASRGTPELPFFFSIFLHHCTANIIGKYEVSLVLILFYFLYNFKYIKVYFHRPQEMGRSHRTVSLPIKKSCIFW